MKNLILNKKKIPNKNATTKKSTWQNFPKNFK